MASTILKNLPKEVGAFHRCFSSSSLSLPITLSLAFAVFYSPCPSFLPSPSLFFPLPHSVTLSPTLPSPPLLLSPLLPPPCLPPFRLSPCQIRLLGYLRVVAGFNAKDFCDRRRCTSCTIVSSARNCCIATLPTRWFLARGCGILRHSHRDSNGIAPVPDEPVPQVSRLLPCSCNTRNAG